MLTNDSSVTVSGDPNPATESTEATEAIESNMEPIQKATENVESARKNIQKANEHIEKANRRFVWMRGFFVGTALTLIITFIMLFLAGIIP